MNFLGKVFSRGGGKEGSGYTPPAEKTPTQSPVSKEALEVKPTPDISKDTQTSTPENTMPVQELRNLAATLTKYENELSGRGISTEDIRTALTVLKQLTEVKHSEEQRKLQDSPLNKLLEIADALPDDVKTKIKEMVTKLKEKIVSDIKKIRSEALVAGENITLEEALQRKKDLADSKWFSFSFSGETGLQPLELNNFQSVSDVLTELVGFDFTTLKKSDKWSGTGADIESVLLPGLRLSVLDRKAMGQRPDFHVDIYLELKAVGTLDPDPSGLKLIIEQAFREYQDQQAS